MTHENVRRASYALPEGVPALQEDPNQSRRCFVVALFFALAAGATAGFSAGAELSGPASVAQIVHRVDPEAAVLGWAEALAVAPDDQLLRDRERFLNVVESHEPSARIWDGVHRLAAQVGPEDSVFLSRLREVLAGDGVPLSVQRALEDSLDQRSEMSPVEER